MIGKVSDVLEHSISSLQAWDVCTSSNTILKSHKHRLPFIATCCRRTRVPPLWKINVSTCRLCRICFYIKNIKMKYSRFKSLLGFCCSGQDKLKERLIRRTNLLLILLSVILPSNSQLLVTNPCALWSYNKCGDYEMTCNNILFVSFRFL